MISSMDGVYEYIYSFINTEKNEKVLSNNRKIYSIDSIKKYLKYFNNIHNDLKIIHIAGTKGKGSVSLFISYLLKSLGKNVTTFLSPHLIDINERFLFNLRKISNEDLICLTNEVKKVIEKNEITPTTFELLFIIFLLFSKKEKADIVVLETGLGGRLDCTNIVDPILSVITPVSKDHTNILGRSLFKIAGEKAGIIKAGKPVVLSTQKIIPRLVIFKKAKKSKSILLDVKQYISLISYELKENGIQISFTFLDRKIDCVFLPLLGTHQIYNFFQSLLSVYFFNPEILDVVDKQKFINIEMQGRLQIINKLLPVIVDVAHNKDSAKKLKEALLQHYPGLRWVVLSGMAAGKDYDNFYKELRGIVDEMVITSLSTYKKSSPEDVYRSSLKFFKKSKLIFSLEEAINYSLSQNKPLLVTGSFYIVGPFLEKMSALKKI